VSKTSDIVKEPFSESESAPLAATAPATQPRPATIEVKDAGVNACYANFCRVTGTPEELIVDFGLNPNPTPTEPVVVTQRIVTNYYTAKRMLYALQLTVQRHEQAFGVLETDIQKRVISRTS
jgi:Protein of unknown function (DUF3467)